MTTPTAPTADALAHAPRRVGQIAIVVRDPERALRFYRDVLGLPLLFQAPPDLAFLDCGGVRLMLTPAQTAEEGRMASVIYYDVADIHAAHAALAARGADFEREPHVVARLDERDLWMAFLRDPEGNLLGIMSEAARG